MGTDGAWKAYQALPEIRLPKQRWQVGAAALAPAAGCRTAISCVSSALSHATGAAFGLWNMWTVGAEELNVIPENWTSPLSPEHQARS